MTVCRNLFALVALALVLLAAGCGRSERTVVGAETDERAYLDGQQLKSQGRYNEALAAFLRVIEKRGEQASAESHLEAGLLYLERMKDPIEAIHQFKKYLQLQPNAPRAGLVRARVDLATRQFALTLRGPNPLESVQLEQQDLVERLQRENEELKKENQALRSGGGAAPMLRTFRLTPEPDAAGARVESAPPPPIVASGLPSPLSAAPLPSASPGQSPPMISGFLPPPPVASPAARPSVSAATGGRRHTIVAKDTLYRISVKYFGNGSKVDDIFNANRDLMPNRNTLPPIGTELKIP